MYAEPNERSTLLAKHQRRRKYAKLNTNANANGSASPSDDETDATNSTLESHDAAASPAAPPTDDASDTTCECMPNHRNLRYYLIEPMVLILLFAYNLSATIVKNQIIYQTCTAVYDYNETDCRLLGTKNVDNHTKQIETLVQPYAARIFMSSSLIESIVPALCGIFIGAWSDRFGRKPLLVTAFSGYALYYAIAAIISALCATYTVSPWYYLLAVLPQSMVGGSVTYSVATFCYISDVSSVRERPYRMALYEAALYIGLMTGSFAAGYIYDATDATTVFLISTACILVATFIIACFIPESLNMRRLSATLEPNDLIAEAHVSRVGMHDPLEQSEQLEQPAQLEQSQQCFDLQLLREMLETCFKPRDFNDRTIIWLAIAALLTSTFVIDGSMTVFYLFIREQFHWNIKEYTTYETINILVPIIGNLASIVLLRKFFNVSIVHLGILAFLSEAVSSLVKAFAYANWQLYLAIGLGALKSIAHPMCRTIVANIVPAHELGKLLSCHSVLQSLLPFIASPVYTGLYSITLSSFPGFFNLLNTNLFLLAIAFLLVILAKMRAFPVHYENRF